MTIHVPKAVVRLFVALLVLAVGGTIARQWGDMVRYAKLESMSL